MTDVFEHNPGDHEDPLAGPTWLMGFLGAVTLVAIIGALTALYYNEKNEEVEDQIVIPPREEVADLTAQQEALLAGPPRSIIRQEQGEEVRAYVIPIDRAMELVVREYGTPAKPAR